MVSLSSTPWIQSLLSTRAYTMFVGVACAAASEKPGKRLVRDG